MASRSFKLAWALREIGFEVQLLSAAVGRANFDGPEFSAHLALLVGLEEGLYLADVGFGDGFPEPVPLREGEYVQDGFSFRLEHRATVNGERWVMHNHAHGGAPHFDFSTDPRDMTRFADQCDWLQTSPDSGFVQTTVCQRFTGNGYVTLRGAVFKTLARDGETSRVLETQDEYTRVLRDHFGLEISDVGRLWEKVWVRHLEWVQKNTV